MLLLLVLALATLGLAACDDDGGSGGRPLGQARERSITIGFANQRSSGDAPELA